MLTKNIFFKNFESKKNNFKVKNDFRLLIKEKIISTNILIKAL